MPSDDETELVLEDASSHPEVATSSNVQGRDVAYDIPVKVSVVLGSTFMQVRHILKLGRGAVLELDRKVGEAINIFVNDRLIARGEVMVVEDRLALTITEIIKTDKN